MSRLTGIQKRRRQKRQHELVVSGEVKTFPSLQGRALHHVGRRPVLADEIKVRGGEMPHFMPQIARHGQGLQKDFRQEHRGTEVQVGSAFQSAHQAAEEAEVVVARFG